MIGKYRLFLCLTGILPTVLSGAAYAQVPSEGPSIAREDAPTLDAQGGEVILSLADSVFLGVRNNRDIRSAYIDRVVEKFSLRVAEDIFTPHFNIRGSLRRKDGDSHSSDYVVSPNVTMKTPLGTVFDFSWNTKGGLEKKNEDPWSSTVEVAVKQPLLRGAGIDVNMAPLNVARLAEKSRKLQLKASVSRTITLIIGAHRNLLAAQEELRLARDAVRRGEEMLKRNRILIEAGRMPETDAVQTEADLESQKLRALQAEQDLDRVRLALLDLLALDLSTPIVAREDFTFEDVSLDLDHLIKVALEERSDYQGQLYVVEQSKLDRTVARNEQAWDVSLALRGQYGRENPGGGASSPRKKTYERSVALELDIPLNDLSRRQRLVVAEAGQQKAEVTLDRIRSGIEKTIRTSAKKVELNWQQLKVAETSLALAQQALDIANVKLTSGRASTFEVRSMEDALRNAERQLLNARVSYLDALTSLDLELGTTLETWKISLND